MTEDRYTIQEKIGQGGVGAVYKAYDKNLNREVAIKRVLTEEGFDANDSEDGATKSLLKEAIALCSVQHPHIVTVYDAGIDEDGPYVVMELLSGKTMDEIDPLQWNDFRETVNQTLEALIAAQTLDLVHRDIKPSNVMVSTLPSGRFQVKLVDFGLAKFSAKPSLQTIDHGDAVFGSIHFMAPEQFERIPLDKRTDMYSLGCVYYFSLTGEYPFDGETAPQVMASHLENRYTPLKERRPDIPDWACQWVEWHLNRNMDDRPATALEALAKFNSLEELETPSTGPVSVAIQPAQGGQNPITGPVPAITGPVPAITGPVPAQTQNPNNSEGHKPRLLTGSVPPAAEAQPALATSIEEQPALTQTGLLTSRPQTQTTPLINLKSSNPLELKKKKQKLIGLAAGITIGFLGLALVVGGGSGEQKERKAIATLLTKAADPLETELKLNSNQLKSLLALISASPSQEKEQPIYRALFLSKANDATNIDREIANFATQSDNIVERQRVKLFEVLERRNSAAPLSTLLGFMSSSQEEDAVIAAMKAAQKHLTKKDLSHLHNLIASSRSKRVRTVAKQTVEDYFKISKASASSKKGKKLAAQR